MSFVDKVNITVTAGEGGDGRSSFRHERFIAKGGPDGGNGGNGGDIIFKANKNDNTLASFRYRKHLSADHGQPGGKSRKHGKNGSSLVISLPLGTQIQQLPDGRIVGDLISDGQEVVVAKGGRGGFGNAHFTSSTRQAPNFAEKGEKGQSYELSLELKLIADVGLVGLPNAGKSTLLSRLSKARPEIADYPFTTLSPNLGVLDVDEHTSILLADIPGLIEGAALGKGLGHQFLRHIERTRLIVHLIDVYNEDIAASYHVIRQELKAYSPKLAKLPEVVVLNKIDGYSPAQLKAQLTTLLNAVPRGARVLAVSAKAGTNLKELQFLLKRTLADIKPPKPKKAAPSIPVIKLSDNSAAFSVSKKADAFYITGQKIEQFADRTDFNNTEAVDRFKHILRRMGILHELTRQGLKAGDRIHIGPYSFSY